MPAVVHSRPSRSRQAGTAATAATSTRTRLGSNNGAGSRRRPTAPRLHAAARAARGARKKREGGPTRSLYVAAAFFFQRAALFDYLLGEGCLSIMAARRPARTLAPSFDVAPPGGDIQTRGGAGRRANEKAFRRCKTRAELEVGLRRCRRLPRRQIREPSGGCAAALARALTMSYRRRAITAASGAVALGWRCPPGQWRSQHLSVLSPRQSRASCNEDSAQLFLQGNP